MNQPTARRPRQARKLMGAALAITISLAGATACGSDDDKPGDSGSGSTLVVALTALGGMNWAPDKGKDEEEKMLINVGDSFVDLDPTTLQYTPGLVESWDISPDGKTWDFKLRPDVPFQGGWGNVTSDDVKFTYGLWISDAGKEQHQARAFSMAQAVDDNLDDNFEIVSDLEFKLHTEHPVVDLLSTLCSCQAGMTVTSKKYIESTDAEEVNDHPVGTGPWEFVSSKPGVEIVLKKWEDKHPWRPTPGYDNLILKEIADPAARLAQVQSGAVQIAELSSGLMEEAEANGVQIVSAKDTGHADVILGGMYFNDPGLDVDAPWVQGDSPQSPKGLAIRQAMSLAIDRESILKTILHDQGELVYGPMVQYNSNQELTDPAWTLPAYDVDRAKELMTEGGYPDGFSIELMEFDQGVDSIAIAQAIADMWGKIGIDVKQTVMDEDLFKSDYLEKKSTDGVAWVKVLGFYTEPSAGFAGVLRADQGNDKFFHPSIDDGYPQLLAEPDQHKRFALGRQIVGDLIRDDMPDPLFSVNSLYAASSSVAEGSFQPYPGLNTISNLESAQPKR